MPPTLVDPANLFRLLQFCDILAAVVFAVSRSLASRKGTDVVMPNTPGIAHVILAVTDNGTPSLTSYRQMILTIQKPGR